jgi:hypothetical protein
VEPGAGMSAPDEDVGFFEALVMFVLVLFGIILSIHVFTWGWAWHLVPLGAPPITAWQALAFSTLFGMLPRGGAALSPKKKERDTRRGLWVNSLTPMLGALLALALLWGAR